MGGFPTPEDCLTVGTLSPHVEVQLTGEDGYTFAVLGPARMALRWAGVDAENIAALTRATS